MEITTNALPCLKNVFYKQAAAVLFYKIRTSGKQHVHRKGPLLRAVNPRIP